MSAKKIPLKLVANDSQVEQLSLYESSAKIYPREVRGRYASLRLWSMSLLLGIYYFVPWIQYQGRQAILFDLPARKFYLFAWTMWPQDFVYLAALLILAALSLFFFTALAGRLWCGYACPQTVWTEAFVLLERMAEGDYRTRKKLDLAPWSKEKIIRKLSKHSLWIIFALFTGFTFVGYFSDIRALAIDALHWKIGGWELFWGLFYSLATWGNAGVLREQVCKYMCPYARFQSAMFDRDTLIISYNTERGEPRGSRGKNIPSVLSLKPENTEALELDKVSTLSKLGDCIDCKICVQVCPTGIDIRNGLQIECIACGSCVDACNSVMDKIGYPRGLVQYTTQNAQDHKNKKILRTRIVIYAGLLLAISGFLLWSILTRAQLHLDVIRDRNALYRVLEDGQITNSYSLKLINKSNKAQTIEVKIKTAANIKLQTPVVVTVPAESTYTAIATIISPNTIVGKHDVQFVAQVQAHREISSTQTSRFFAPGFVP